MQARPEGLVEIHPPSLHDLEVRAHHPRHAQEGGSDDQPVRPSGAQVHLTGQAQQEADMNYSNEIWIEREDGTRVLYQQFIADDSYMPEESFRLRAHWGERVGETMCGSKLIEISSNYIQDMRVCLDQQVFTEWYLWKFYVRPSTTNIIPFQTIQAEQLQLFT